MATPAADFENDKHALDISRPGLQNMPPELLLDVAENLTSSDLLALRETDHARLHALITGNEKTLAHKIKIREEAPISTLACSLDFCGISIAQALRTMTRSLPSSPNRQFRLLSSQAAFYFAEVYLTANPLLPWWPPYVRSEQLLQMDMLSTFAEHLWKVGPQMYVLDGPQLLSQVKVMCRLLKMHWLPHQVVMDTLKDLREEPLSALQPEGGYLSLVAEYRAEKPKRYFVVSDGMAERGLKLPLMRSGAQYLLRTNKLSSILGGTWKKRIDRPMLDRLSPLKFAALLEEVEVGWEGEMVAVL